MNPSVRDGERSRGPGLAVGPLARRGHRLRLRGGGGAPRARAWCGTEPASPSIPTVTWFRNPTSASPRLQEGAIVDGRSRAPRATSKAELHVHLDGSLRPETIWELAQEQEVDLPADSADGIRRWFTDELPERDLVGYLSRFDVSTSVMQTKEALERIAFELVEDAAAENVWYLEVRYAPILLTKRGLSPRQVVDAVQRGSSGGTRRTPDSVVPDHLRAAALRARAGAEDGRARRGVQRSRGPGLRSGGRGDRQPGQMVS